MSPSQLKHLLIEVSIDLKITVLEQLLAKLVVRSEDKARENGTELANLMDDPLGFGEAKPDGVYFIRVFTDGKRSLDESKIFALFIGEAQRDVAAPLDIPVAYRRIKGRLVAKKFRGIMHGFVVVVVVQ